ncbi:hypothetical protein [Verminephrobacter eiseniae]|uniref:hypothetical protein n=1 Tax=Verminephrobacter eiseniae TaxID=364317 RepID=UPI00032679FA|nr:hypothetical protein [Verminephrobacter eiseniae]
MIVPDATGSGVRAPGWVNIGHPELTGKRAKQDDLKRAIGQKVQERNLGLSVHARTGWYFR